jgi:selenocysteine-specific elongation factor
MPLIGTAGHVDHGKSTLIRLITGRDPDRWEEEKRRGLTIDLGFAWTTLPNGTEVSFVDVPGHERYLKNMLAGIESIDVALFVVAADEGWMPQSEEHLAVLDLLGVDRGVVALNKIDSVDQELVAIAREEIQDKLAGTSLEEAPIADVSGATGDGVETLLEALTEIVPDDPVPDGRPRLWVDRSFPVSGAGTVVTGSLLGSTLSVDDTIEVYPTGITARVRGLQSHEASHDTAKPGTRVAINLGGVDHDRVSRGDMIGLPGQWELSNRFAVGIRPARFIDDLDQRGAYQAHIGSSAHRVELLGLDEGVAVLRIDRSLPMAVGDRFILRDTGRKLVVAGGSVVDPAPGRTRAALNASRAIAPEESPDAIADRLLAIRGIEHAERLAAHSQGGIPTSALLVGTRALFPDLVDELAGRAVLLVDEEQDRHPLRPGLSMATLAERLGVDADIAEFVVERSPTLERTGPDVSRSGRRPILDDEQERAWQDASQRLARGLMVPDESELGIDREVVHFKVRNGDLVRVSEELVYLPAQIEEMTTAMSQLGEEFTVAEFRDAVGLSRKYAVPILEWSDKKGLTVRRGDVRRFR